MLVLRLAWRNAWRSPRRTGIVVTAVAVGIAGTLLSMAFNFGMIIQMVETAISTDLGHVQVHAAGFDRNPELEVRLKDGGRAGEAALADAGLAQAWARRVRAEGLVSSPRSTAGVRVVGIEPEREAQITTVASSITAGSYLGDDPRRALIGEELASRLEVSVGDKIVLSVQDLSGDLAGEALRVAGLFRTPSRPLDSSTVFLPLEQSQSLLGLDGAVSELVVVATSRDEIEGVAAALEAALPEDEVHTWEELQPVLVYLVDLFDQSALFLYSAIFIAMAFGIANVLLMTVFERTREIGIMRAIGLARGKLIATIVTESLIVTLVGVAIGFVGATLGVLALRDGIDLSGFADNLDAWGVGQRIKPVLRTRDFVAPVAVAIVTAVLASAWPAWRAVRLKPAEAVRHS